MFQKVFLLNPDMLPCCLLASGSGRMFGKKKNVEQGTRLLGPRAPSRPLREEEEKHSLALHPKLPH